MYKQFWSRGRFTSARASGFALISVLWGIVLLSFIAIVVSQILTSSYKMDRAALQEVYLDAVADAALNRAAHQLIQSAATKKPVPFGKVTQWSFDGANVQMTIFPELGKVDLNQADGGVLKALFVAIGMERRQATQVSAMIVGRRPRAIEGGGRSPSSLFLSIAEVRHLPHMTDGMFERLSPAITVHSQKHVYDPALVFSEVLRSVRGIDGGPSATSEYRASRYAGNWIKGQAFQVLMDIEAEGRSQHRSAVIRIILSPHKPYWVLEQQ